MHVLHVQYQEITDKSMHFFFFLQAVFRSPDGSIAESLDSNYMSS